MTVKGKEGDEWINSADETQWLHDGTTWQPRPIADRLAGAKSAMFTTDWRANNNAWVKIPETDFTFTKKHPRTRLYVEGHITMWGTLHDDPKGVKQHSGLNTSAWFAPYVHGHNVMQGGNPPGDSKDAIGFLWYNYTRHKVCLLAGFVRDSEMVTVGQHTIELQTGTKHGWVHRNGDDCWALRVWEVQ